MRNTFLFLSVLFALILYSCSSDSPKILTLEKSRLDMFTGTAEVVKIKGVEPLECHITSSDPFSVSAEFLGEDIYINAFYAGESEIKVRYMEQEATIKVKVELYDECYIGGIVYDFGISKNELDKKIEEGYSSKNENAEANSVDYKYERGTDIVIDRYFFNEKGMFAVKKELYSILPNSYPTGTGNSTQVSMLLRNYGVLKDSSNRNVYGDNDILMYKIKYELYEHTGKYFIYREEIEGRQDGKENTFSIYYAQQSKDAINHTFDK